MRSKKFILRAQCGLTFFELILVVGIVLILATIAFPSYESYLQSARRSDAMTALVNFAQRAERHFLENGSYEAISTDMYTDTSHEGYYTLSVTTTETTYLLRATPVGAQENDTKCGEFTLNEQGEKGITGTDTVENCW